MMEFPFHKKNLWEKQVSFCFVAIILFFSIFNQFSLVIKHGKFKVFHFSRLYGNFNPPLLNLSSIKGPILWLEDTWRYLGFIFDKKLSFCQHIKFYANNTLSTVKCMKMLGNLMRELISHEM